MRHLNYVPTVVDFDATFARPLKAQPVLPIHIKGGTSRVQVIPGGCFFPISPHLALCPFELVRTPSISSS